MASPPPDVGILAESREDAVPRPLQLRRPWLVLFLPIVLFVGRPTPSAPPHPPPRAQVPGAEGVVSPLHAVTDFIFGESLGPFFTLFFAVFAHCVHGLEAAFGAFRMYQAAQKGVDIAPTVAAGYLLGVALGGFTHLVPLTRAIRDATDANRK